MKLISGLSEGQVLQRRGKAGATVLLRGESTTDGPVLATLTQGGRALAGWRRRKVGAARRGSFSVKIEGIPAGGPYRLKLETGGKTRRSIEVKSFYVGDVWVLAGQSNMEGSGRLPGLAKSHPLVRAFSQRREWRLAMDPLHVHGESPDTCHNYGRQITRKQAEEWRRRASCGAGAGVHFGREMLARSGVPQGLVCVARGGSSMSQWDPQVPDQLYASMMAAVRATGQPVAGVLWYQGESDTSAESTPRYTENMKALVSATRRDLRQSRLPWVIVQLARVVRAGTGEWWNRVQEQQRLLPSLIPQLAMVAAIDLSLDDEIHIGAADMPRLGKRLARAADRFVHRNDSEPPMPDLRRVRRTVSTEDSPGSKCGLDVFFDGIEGGLKSDGEPSGFFLVDAQGVEQPAIFKTTLHADHVRLHLMRPPALGFKLGYGRGYAPRCNLTDGRDLAVPVFAPVEIGGGEGLLPFVTRWRVATVVETEAVIDSVAKPDFNRIASVVKTYADDGFINEHDAWQRLSGHGWFAATIELKHAAALEFLMGYDGPFRLWLDGKPFFTNVRGTNPCIADESGKIARLAAGHHEIVVGMDINHGMSWGFFLRFRCTTGRLITDADCIYSPTQSSFVPTRLS